MTSQVQAMGTRVLYTRVLYNGPLLWQPPGAII